MRFTTFRLVREGPAFVARRRQLMFQLLAATALLAGAAAGIVEIRAHASHEERVRRTLSDLLAPVAAETTLALVVIDDRRFSPADEARRRRLDSLLQAQTDNVADLGLARGIRAEATRYDVAIERALALVAAGRFTVADEAASRRSADRFSRFVGDKAHAADVAARRWRRDADIASILIAAAAIAGLGWFTWQLQRARRRLLRAGAEALHLAEQRQAQKMDSVGRLSAGIAHDFNNLLTGTIGHLSLVLGRLPADDANRHSLETALESAFSAANLTKQLLAYGRRQTLEPTTIGTRQLIDGIKGLVAGVVREEIIVTYDQHDDSSVFIEQGEIQQVLLNLVVNAQDATTGNGMIEIGVGVRQVAAEYVRNGQRLERGSYAAITVTDTGHGMTDETAAKIFEPYFTTKGTLGHGLGLSTSIGIVAQSHGMLAVTSEPGVGTTFELLLPLAPADINAPHRHVVTTRSLIAA